MKTTFKLFAMILMAGSLSLASCEEAAKETESKVMEVSEEAKKQADQASQQIDDAMEKVQEQGAEVEKLLEDL
ncbi:MAG: hypothetical protein AAF193_02835 [Bacteroidota bacterium]